MEGRGNSERKSVIWKQNYFNLSYKHFISPLVTQYEAVLLCRPLPLNTPCNHLLLLNTPFPPDTKSNCRLLVTPPQDIKIPKVVNQVFIGLILGSFFRCIKKP